ncbi:MAG TPA: hypothetical protein VHZ95_14660, partial [Polyangiales bacterium]|nr:hypothetical protein [Polyangiales bacterium]
ISKSMGDLQWGVTKDELQKQLIDKVKEHYRPLVAKTHDAVEEDRLRQAATEEMKRIRDSYVEFKGTATGWDVSFLRGEFTHGNDESMLVMRDQNSQNFYFFIDGKLWKWYKAFDAEVFPADDFSKFADSVQRRFGPAKDAQGELSPGAGVRHWLEWQDDKTRLRAVDQTDFYGFYCLVFEQKSTVANLASLRKNTRDVNPNKQNALVEAVTAPPSRDSDGSSDVVDRITGKSHARPAPAANGGKASKSGATAEPAPPPPTGVKSDDDPLRGLGL